VKGSGAAPGDTAPAAIYSRKRNGAVTRFTIDRASAPFTESALTPL
jgi:hypothetical protein